MFYTHPSQLHQPSALYPFPVKPSIFIPRPIFIPNHLCKPNLRDGDNSGRKLLGVFFDGGDVGVQHAVDVVGGFAVEAQPHGEGSACRYESEGRDAHE